MRFTDPSGLQAREMTSEQGVLFSFMKGLWGNAGDRMLQYAFNIQNQLMFGGLVFYNDAKNLLDGTTANSIVQKYQEITSSPSAFAEFGGNMTFDLVFFNYVAGAGGAGTAGEAAATATEATAASSAKTMTAPSMTRLFRAVEVGEMADLKTIGQFRSIPGQVEGKYFAMTREGAEQFAKMATAQYGFQYQIIETSIPTSEITPAFLTTVDRGIPTIFVPADKLHLLSPPK